MRFRPAPLLVLALLAGLSLPTALLARAAGLTMSSGRITILTAPAPPPEAPVIEGSDPASPADDEMPALYGDADDGTTVLVFPAAGCSGSPAFSGSAAQFESAGIPVTVTDGSTTTFSAISDGPNGASSCSNSFVYEEQP